MKPEAKGDGAGGGNTAVDALQTRRGRKVLRATQVGGGGRRPGSNFAGVPVLEGMKAAAKAAFKAVAGPMGCARTVKGGESGNEAAKGGQGALEMEARRLGS